MSKKPNMKKFGVKYLAIGICIMLAFSIIGSIVAVCYYCDVYEKECEKSFQFLSETIEEDYNKMMEYPYAQEENMGYFMSSIQWAVNSMCAINDCAISIYDVATQSKLLGEKEMAGVILSVDRDTDEKKTYILECDVEKLSEAVDLYNKEQVKMPYDDESGIPIEYTVNFIIDDVYMCGGKAVPGKMRLVKVYMSGDDNMTVLAEYDYTPKDTSNFQHIVVANDDSKRILGPVFWKPECANVDAVLDTYVAENVNNGTFWRYAYEYDNQAKAWGRYCLYQDRLVLSEDLEIKVVAAFDLDLFAEHGKWIVIIYVISFLLTVLVSLLLAYRAYMKQRNRYELDQYRRETTNAMAHDLKTPLMTISGCAENLRDNIHTEKKEHYADLILEQVHVMNEMIANILELSKLEQIENLHHKELVDLRKLAEDSWRNCEVLADSKNIDLEIQGECSIQADKNMMTQALDNLMVNAIKYAKADSCICVKLETTAFEMSNLIEKELDVDVDTLWKPFVKGDNSRNEQRGTGIGLSIVKNIMDLHGFGLALQCVEKEFVVKITF